MVGWIFWQKNNVTSLLSWNYTTKMTIWANKPTIANQLSMRNDGAYFFSLWAVWRLVIKKPVRNRVPRYSIIQRAAVSKSASQFGENVAFNHSLEIDCSIALPKMATIVAITTKTQVRTPVMRIDFAQKSGLNLRRTAIIEEFIIIYTRQNTEFCIKFRFHENIN